MLRLGKMRSGFIAFPPDLTRSQPASRQTSATMRKATSGAAPIRIKRKLAATNRMMRPANMIAPPAAKAITPDASEPALCASSDFTRLISLETNWRNCRMRSSISCSVGVVISLSAMSATLIQASAHLADEQADQAGDGDGAPGVLADARADIFFHRDELVLRRRGRLREIVARRADRAHHRIARARRLLLHEIAHRLGEFGDFVAEAAQIDRRGRRGGRVHAARNSVPGAAIGRLRLARDRIVNALRRRGFILQRLARH